MKLIAALALIAITITTTAKAGDDFHGPYEPRGYSAPVSAPDLSDQTRASSDHRNAALNDLAERYGHPCYALSSEVLPLWIAERCNAPVFGEPMGSMGGSD